MSIFAAAGLASKVEAFFKALEASASFKKLLAEEPILAEIYLDLRGDIKTVDFAKLIADVELFLQTLRSKP